MPRRSDAAGAALGGALGLGVGVALAARVGVGVGVGGGVAAALGVCAVLAEGLGVGGVGLSHAATTRGRRRSRRLTRRWYPMLCSSRR
jgi:hypothetical protein